MTQPIPKLDLVQGEADRLHNEGYDVHTMKLVLWDGHIWQVTLEATDADLGDHSFRYHLDLYGYHLEAVERHHA